jgi:spore maturation protein CgeB
MRILAVGPLWRGSNAGGLFRALSRYGCYIDIIDEFYYISLKSKTKIGKIIQRIVRPHQIFEYNSEIINSINVFKPEIVLVYKGAFVAKETLIYARDSGCRLVLFYPDVSMTAHGGNLPQCIPLYEIIFTTKTFGIHDLGEMFNVKTAVFVPHGFDPEIHRKLTPSPSDRETFGCDVSFIGTWSPKKEEWLIYLAENLPKIHIKIWGSRWHNAGPKLKPFIQGKVVIGDLYALAIQCSSINLALLSEKVSGSSSGDNITSRTFHIPGTSGFMLHERNEESILYFEEGKEAAFFDTKEEMVQKVRYYLENTAEKEEIRINGYKRAIENYSLDSRAEFIINIMNTKLFNK